MYVLYLSLTSNSFFFFFFQMDEAGWLCLPSLQQSFLLITYCEGGAVFHEVFESAAV